MLLSDTSFEVVEKKTKYFKWKMGKYNHSKITREMALRMINEASTLLEEYYEKHPKAYENMDVYYNEDPWQQTI